MSTGNSFQNSPSDVLFLIAGHSGSGKDAIVDIVCREHGMSKVISKTTRPKRFEQEDTHVFLSDSEFDALCRNNDLVGYSAFAGYRYGADRNDIKGKDFYIIDIAGIEYIRSLSQDGLPAVYVIAITANRGERIRRMRNRGDSDKTIAERIKHDEEAFRKLGSVMDALVDTSGISMQEAADKLFGIVLSLKKVNSRETGLT